MIKEPTRVWGRVIKKREERRVRECGGIVARILWGVKPTSLDRSLHHLGGGGKRVGKKIHKKGKRGGE